MQLDKLQRVLKDSFQNAAIRDVELYGVFVSREGSVLAEQYVSGFDRLKNHRMYSIAKSFVGIAVLQMVKEGLLQIDDCLVDFFPEYSGQGSFFSHPWLSKLTILNCLQMQTCFAQTTYKDFYEKDWVKTYFYTKPHHAPGTIFCYDTSAAMVLCALVRKLTGKDLLDYLRNYYPISEEAYFLQDLYGNEQGGSGLVCSMEDLRQVGHTLNHKIRNHENLFVDSIFHHTHTFSRTAFDERFGYGCFIWGDRTGKGFVFYGMGGQLLLSDPENDILIGIIADVIGDAAHLADLYDLAYRLLEICQKNQSVHTLFPDKKLLEKSTIFPKQNHYHFRISENPIGISEIIIRLENSFPISIHFKGNQISLPLPGYKRKAECKDICFRIEQKDNRDNLYFSAVEDADKCLLSGSVIGYADSNYLYLQFLPIGEELGRIILEFAINENSEGTIYFSAKGENGFAKWNGYYLARQEKLR